MARIYLAFVQLIVTERLAKYDKILKFISYRMRWNSPFNAHSLIWHSNRNAIIVVISAKFYLFFIHRHSAQIVFLLSASTTQLTLANTHTAATPHKNMKSNKVKQWPRHWSFLVLVHIHFTQSVIVYKTISRHSGSRCVRTLLADFVCHFCKCVRIGDSATFASRAHQLHSLDCV